MSSLRKYQKAPKHVISNAIHLFRSSNKKTLVVEGINDSKFFHQWMDPKSDVRIVDVDGKDNVEEIYKIWSKDHKAKDNCLYLLADIDYDFVINNQVKFNDEFFVYNFYCRSTNKPLYNDMEAFLVGSTALEKLLVNYLISKDEVKIIRDGLERLTNIIGCFRVADEILTSSHQRSIIDGLNLCEFCNVENFTFDIDLLKNRLKSYSPRKLDLDELYDKANELRTSVQPKWFFSRGHDITEILSIYLSIKLNKNVTVQTIELNLRLAANIQTFKKSVVGEQLIHLTHKDGLKFLDEVDL